MASRSYEQLLTENVPQVIETEEQYKKIHQQFGELFDKRKGRTTEETKYMKLLGLLIQDYDRRHSLPADEDTPAERLKYLLEASGKTLVELEPVFGQKSHASEALNGKRPISADQARKLGDFFKVNPGYFL